MAQGYMISNRNVESDQLGTRLLKNPKFFITKASGARRETLKNWDEVNLKEFYQAIRDEIKKFPVLPEEQNEKQKHLSLFVHGYNNSWIEAVQRYSGIQDSLYKGANGLGTLLLFTWPSNDRVSGYLPDREDARDSAPQLADLFVQLLSLIHI